MSGPVAEGNAGAGGVTCGREVVPGYLGRPRVRASALSSGNGVGRKVRVSVMGREEAQPAVAGSEDGRATSQWAWLPLCAGHREQILRHRLQNKHSLSRPRFSLAHLYQTFDVQKSKITNARHFKLLMFVVICDSDRSKPICRPRSLSRGHPASPSTSWGAPPLRSEHRPLHALVTVQTLPFIPCVCS